MPRQVEWSLQVLPAQGGQNKANRGDLAGHEGTAFKYPACLQDLRPSTHLHKDVSRLIHRQHLLAACCVIYSTNDVVILMMQREASVLAACFCLERSRSAHASFPKPVPATTHAALALYKCSHLPCACSLMPAVCCTRLGWLPNLAFHQTCVHEQTHEPGPLSRMQL